MPVIEVKNLKGKSVGNLELADEVFGAPVNRALIWEAVHHYEAAQRQGTADTKTRGEVSGGGKKPWRQKGTGRARVGSSRNPIWVHGGTVFGPTPRDYDYAFPKKKRRGALRAALSGKLKDQKLAVVENFSLESAKTKDFRRVLDEFEAQHRVLIVNHDRENTNLLRSARNLRDVKLVQSSSLNIFDVMFHDTLLFTRDAILQLQGDLEEMKTKFNILESPHLTEKATRIKENTGVLVFKVRRNATKDDIRHAVEKMFSVKVAAVRTANFHGKKKRMGRFAGRRSDWKKAFVMLQPGEKTIEFFENV